MTKPETQELWVWVDDGMGPIIAAWSKDQNHSLKWIREPRHIKRSLYDPVIMDILDDEKLKLYRDCIKEVQDKAKQKKKD